MDVIIAVARMFNFIPSLLYDYSRSIIIWDVHSRTFMTVWPFSLLRNEYSSMNRIIHRERTLVREIFLKNCKCVCAHDRDILIIVIKQVVQKMAAKFLLLIGNRASRKIGSLCWLYPKKSPRICPGFNVGGESCSKNGRRAREVQ